MLTHVFVVLASYPLSSIPFAFLITKLVTGQDICYENDL